MNLEELFANHNVERLQHAIIQFVEDLSIGEKNKKDGRENITKALELLLSQCQQAWLKQTLEMIEREKVQDIFKDSMLRDYMSKTNRGWNNALTTLQTKLKGSNQ